MWACTLQASTGYTFPRRIPRIPECTCSSSAAWTPLGMRRAPDSSCSSPEAFRSNDKCESLRAGSTPHYGHHVVCHITKSALVSTFQRLSARSQHAVSTRTATSRSLEGHPARATPGWDRSTLPALQAATRSMALFDMEALTMYQAVSMNFTTQNNLY